MRSSLRDPVGPEDRSVYVRRRIIVLVALVAIIAAIVLIIVRPGSASEKPDTAVDVPTDVQEKPTATNTGEPTACAPADLLVTPVTDLASYGEGELPQLSLTVKNTGDAKCIADLGTQSMSFTVSSGDDSVWRSTDCQVGGESLPVVLKKGEQLETEAVLWDRTRSSVDSCDITRDEVVGGGASYHLSVTAAGVEGEETAQFLLY